MEPSQPPITCPYCGAEVQVQLGMAPAVVWQAMRLQSARPGAIAFCANCESYFVFGPGSFADELQAVAADPDEDVGAGSEDVATVPEQSQPSGAVAE